MRKIFIIHVISNTHWDREWLYNFQETRLMLVEMIDSLLKILDEEPSYKSFVLDSQTVPIEDYLEIRPLNKEKIKKHVKDGRLLIGPWYTAPEGFLVNGESLVRNLLIGHRVARAFGKVMKVGYTPFGYGQNSQMPQIYLGFGIDTMLFYHGVSHDEVKNEFWFEGADGSRVLGSQMSSGARYNFYHNIYRPVVKGKTIQDRSYKWNEGNLSFHLADEANALDHHRILKPSNQFNKKSLEKAVKALRDSEKNVATTRHLTFMSGHDSSVPDTVEVKIIELAKQYLGDDKLIHSSLPELMEKIKSESKNLNVLRGERRTPKMMGNRVHLFSDVLSSRTRMKIQNNIAEYQLQRMAEPFATIAWILGSEYPQIQLEIAWKTLLQCHAHDSIAGSGVDDIEQDMIYRLRQVRNLSQSLLLRSLGAIQLHIDTSELHDDDVLITVYNPSPYVRSEVVTAILDIPLTKKATEFTFTNVSNNETAQVQICSRKTRHAVINQPGEATLMMDSDQIKLHFEAKDIPPLGYDTYFFNVSENISGDSLLCGQDAMENKHLHVQINNDGTLTITDKHSGYIYKKLHYFEDSGEAGHAWMHIEPAEDQVITSLGKPVTISLEENGPLLACYRIFYSIQIPVGIEENDADKWQQLDGTGGSSKRSDQTLELRITSLVTLRKDSHVVEIKTSLFNNAENHRLRIMFPTFLTDSKSCYAETAFDVVERQIKLSPDNPWYGVRNATFPMQRFVEINDDRVGLSIINKGLREYQVTDDEERTIGITLLRAFEVNLTTVSQRWESHPEMKGSQCLGHHEFEYMIYPHEGDWTEAQVQRYAEQLSIPLIPIQSGIHKGNLPEKFGFIQIEPSDLILSALKQAEDKNGLVIRVYNPTNKIIDGKINIFRQIKSAEMITMEEMSLNEIKRKNNSIQFTISKKKVITIKLVLSNPNES